MKKKEMLEQLFAAMFEDCPRVLRDGVKEVLATFDRGEVHADAACP